MMKRSITNFLSGAVLAAMAPGVMTQPASALETNMQYVLTLTGDVERLQVQYECEGREELLDVEYINSTPNFLAVLAVDEEDPRLFTNVISGSGARYASGAYVWWTKGAEASLYDALTDDPDAPPVLTCLEFNDIP